MAAVEVFWKRESSEDGPARQRPVAISLNSFVLQPSAKSGVEILYPYGVQPSRTAMHTVTHAVNARRWFHKGYCTACSWAY